MVYTPIEADINNTIASAAATDTVYLPLGVIHTPVIVSTPCTVMGQSTIIELDTYELTDPNQPESPTNPRIYDYDEPFALHIMAENATVSDIEIKQRVDSVRDGVLIDVDSVTVDRITSSGHVAFNMSNFEGADFSELKAEGAVIGYLLENVRKSEFTNCEASQCNIGWSLEGTSDILGDSDTDPASTAPGDIITEANRTDRTHLNNFLGLLSHSNQIGIQLVHSNHNTFEASRVYENTNIGIWQKVNSYTNSFKGELYQNKNYGVRNTDKQGNLHDFIARSVWWGDITGPSYAGPGEGDKISNYVTYEPWLQTGTEPLMPYPVTRDWIWRMLGAPLVRVELTEEHISDAIDMAVKRWMRFMMTEQNYYYFSVPPGQQQIDLPPEFTKKQIIEVVYQPHSDLFAQLSGSGESFFLTYYMQRTGGTFLSDFYVAMSYKETFERTLGLVPSFEILSRVDPMTGETIDFVKLYPRPSGTIKCAIKYSRALTEMEVDQESWIRRYALSWAKEQLGRIRSKFGSVPGPTGEMQLDGASLISEAQQERQQLEESLIGRSEPLGFLTG